MTTSDTPPPPSQPNFAPADDGYADRVRASFGRQGMLSTLGAELQNVGPGAVVIRLPSSTAVGQQQGYFHGAAIGAIGDSAGGYASLSLMPADSEVVTVEYKINFIRPAEGAVLIAAGHVLRAGRSLTVARVDISCDGRDVALIQGTFTRVPLTR
ncbi:MAG: PaaI family thioesterase [Pseudomonadota bacterium]